jgi:hypothetical protein
MKLQVCAMNSGDMSCGVRRCERGLYTQGCANLYSGNAKVRNRRNMRISEIGENVMVQVVE